jgi:hypothetical protein
LQSDKNYEETYRREEHETGKGGKKKLRMVTIFTERLEGRRRVGGKT